MRIQKGIQYAYLFTVTLLGMNLRIWAVKALPHMIGEDSLYYQQIAENIFNGYGHTLNGKPIAFKSICYPKILGFFYKVIGNADMANGKMLNVILSTLTFITSYFIYKKLLQKKSSAYIAYAITALLPQYIIYTAVIGYETLLSLLVMIVLFIQLYILDYKISPAILGFVAALCALTKPELIGYPLALVLVILAADKDFTSALKHLVMIGVVFLAALVPWSVRNYMSYEKIILTAYSPGYILYSNNNVSNETGEALPLAKIEDALDTKIKIAQILAQENIEESPELSQVLGKSAKSFIVHNKLQFIKLGFLRMANTYANGAKDIALITNNTISAFFYALSDIMFTILCGGGFIYTISGLKNILYCLIKKERYIDNVAALTCVNILYFLAIIFIYEGGPRHAYPALIFFVIAFARMLEIITENSVDEMDDI